MSCGGSTVHAEDGKIKLKTGDCCTGCLTVTGTLSGYVQDSSACGACFGNTSVCQMNVSVTALDNHSSAGPCCIPTCSPACEPDPAFPADCICLDHEHLCNCTWSGGDLLGGPYFALSDGGFIGCGVGCPTCPYDCGNVICAAATAGSEVNCDDNDVYLPHDCFGDSYAVVLCSEGDCSSDDDCTWSSTCRGVQSDDETTACDCPSSVHLSCAGDGTKSCGDACGESGGGLTVIGCSGDPIDPAHSHGICLFEWTDPEDPPPGGLLLGKPCTTTGDCVGSGFSCIEGHCNDPGFFCTACTDDFGCTNWDCSDCQCSGCNNHDVTQECNEGTCYKKCPCSSANCPEFDDGPNNSFGVIAAIHKVEDDDPYIDPEIFPTSGYYVSLWVEFQLGCGLGFQTRRDFYENGIIFFISDLDTNPSDTTHTFSFADNDFFCPGGSCDDAGICHGGIGNGFSCDNCGLEGITYSVTVDIGSVA